MEPLNSDNWVATYSIRHIVYVLEMVVLGLEASFIKEQLSRLAEVSDLALLDSRLRA